MTLRSIVERALRDALREMDRRPGFRLRRASFGGDGMQAQLADKGWEPLRELTYDGRCG
ncbi:MAG: hypothetical protein R6V85_12260 [Polyangia bacterium]